MKRFALVFAMLVAWGAAAQTSLTVRAWGFKQDVTQIQPQKLAFYEGESLRLTLTNTSRGSAVQLDTNVVVRWDLTSTTNAGVVYMTKTGAVYSASSGVTTYAVSPSEITNIAPGTYKGFVGAFQSVGTNLVQLGVLQYQSVEVLDSPLILGVLVSQPVNPWITDAPSDGTTYGRQNAEWVAVTGGGGSTTDSTARAWAVAASNLAALANANQQAASNSLAARLLAVSNAIPSTANFATGTPVYVESDPVWSGVSNSIRLGINAAQSTGVAAYAAAASRVQYQDTRGFTNSGGVAIGYGMAGDAGLSVGTSTSGPSCFAGGDRSQATGTTSIAYGVVARAFGLGAVALGAGGPNAWGDGSISLGYGPDAYGFASVAIGENAEARGVNAFALGGLSTNSRTYSIGYDAIAGHADSVAIGSGSVTTTSNQLAASFSGGYLLIGGPITGDGSGLTNLPSSGGGAAQSPITNNVNGAAFTISNVNVQVVSQLVVGPGNTIGATATNISIFGGFGANTISNGAHNVVVGGSAHNVAGGANSGGAGILSGTNSSLGASSANSVIAGGRRNRIAGGWESFVGSGNGNFVGTDYSVIGGGFMNSNSTIGAEGATIAGGEYNRANGKYSQVLGGVSNSALATGSAAIGSMGTVAAGGTNSIILQADPLYPATNAAPNSVLVAGRGGLQLAALNGVPWEVGGIRAITNADVRTVTPIRQLAFVYDVGSNAFYIAEGITTNDWQKLTP